MMPLARVWTPTEDEFLREHHGRRAIQEIADEMGRSHGSLRARITRLGLSKHPYWTEGELKALTDLYEGAGRDGVLRLNEFAASIGKDAGNVSRKAGLLGLPTGKNRRVVEQRKERIRKYETDAEHRAAMSARAKEMIRTNGHPRGMLGKHHTAETREHLSKTSKAAALFVSEEARAARVTRAMETRVANGWAPPKVKRGSWDAGWREIGGKRNYYRSRWEANYARYLQWLKERGEITEWQHEPETFWFEAVLRGARSYKPDFRVWENNGTSALHEVKGWMDQRSRTVLKRMAKYHPTQRVIVIDGNQYRAIRSKVMRLVEGWEDAARDAHV